MEIVVCVKHVPDATEPRRFEPDLTIDREGNGILSELDEHAVEQALCLREKAAEPGTVTVTALTMGPARAVDAVRKALQMGADRGVHVQDDAIAGSDALVTSLVLAAAARKTVGGRAPDLLICGMASTDSGMGVVPAMLAERLGVPQVTLASVVEVQDREVRIKRDGDLASEVVGAGMPAVLSVTDQSGEARYPSFKGIMAAKQKQISVISLADLGIATDQVGATAAGCVVDEVVARPARAVGAIVKDDGFPFWVVAVFVALPRPLVSGF